MGFAWRDTGDAIVLPLEGALGIESAVELKQVLEDALKRNKTIHLEVGRTLELDVTAVQLLWATQREAKRLGVGLTVNTALPSAARAVLQDAGFPVPLIGETPV